MVVISKTILNEFCKKHSDAIEPINEWWRKTKDANWANLNDLKQDFNSVDYVGNSHFVFNIKGNKYRLVVMIFFDIRTIYIRFIGTHKAYDKIDCKTI
ncbi:MAG TPA: type II toxin-antitoxin system HigB family toxin [Cyclobacteriaceae bacterium]|nr:type II toxin-antitoxin system HigB family toxin [Cyclobacteriaceae bacterium]